MDTLKVMNVVNFVRGCEPRIEVDLVEPIKKQLELLEKNGLKSTFLLQYDALLRKDMTDLFVGCDGKKTEIGGWFELVRRQVEACGLKWRGRDGYDWDYFAEVDTPMGYSKDERIALVDEFMAKFKTTFGYYPKSMGAWAIDAFTLGYIYDKYNIDAFCICREQVGTDGYNFSGGYYSGGYYASKNNLLCPAQTEENQINAPIFRMLGSDVVKQYYSGLDKNFNPAALQGVVTLEPVGDGKIGGSNPAWVDWFLKVNYGEALNFAYAQAGQENSFGWERMKTLEYQFSKIADDARKGEYEVLTLAECGKVFKSRFKETPATTTTAFGSFDNEREGTVWYENKNYRISYYYSDEKFLIRDVYLFNENYRERYIDDILTSHDYAYDNLPVIDGYLFGGDGTQAGLYLYKNDKEIKFKNLGYNELDEERAEIVISTDNGEFSFLSSQGGISVAGEGEFSLAIKAKIYPYLKNISPKKLSFEFNGFAYEVFAEKGEFAPLGNAFGIKSDNGKITLVFSAV